MQGFVPAASSINTGGGGATTAALHSLQSKYTLVLLDGQRMAPIAQGNAQGGGFAVNLESIPLDAIERVEILTDGASALYGSDAIAGVVNFITKKNKTDTNVFFSNQTPEHPGGRAYSAGISKGWGNLETDGYNFLASYSHDFQHAIKATDRDFSKAGGYIPFSYGGQNYVQIATSANNEPANLKVPTLPVGAAPGTAPTTYQFSPYYNAHGNCGNAYSNFLTVPAAPGTAAGGYCNFNFASFVQDNPSTNRDSGLLKGSFKINEDTTAWAELVLSDTDVVAQFAPPSQPLGISPTKYANLYAKYVQPFLAANNLVLAGSSVTMNYRPIATGGRADDFDTFARHFATGVDGQAFGWGYTARLTLSHSQLKDIAAGGYLDSDKFGALVAAGTVDPLGGSSGTTLAPALLNGTTFSTTESDMDSVHFGGQHDLFDLKGGTSILSVGTDYSYQHYKIGYNDLIASQNGFQGQPASSDFPIGGNYGQVPVDVSRKNWGVYGEWLLPVLKTLEVTASGRYDNYDAAHSNDNFSPNLDPVTGLYPKTANGDLGNSSHGSTYKLSFRWNPHEDLLFRGAFGTGFKAPALTDLAGPLAYAGSSNSFACPFPGLPTCGPGSSQYDLVAGGNGSTGSSALKPEKSKQWTVGFVVDPLKGLTLGADLWAVTIRNQVLSSGIAQAEAFGHPQQYSGLFLTNYADPAGFNTIALEQVPVNGGVAHYKGIDWDNSYRTNLPIGKLTASWTGTWMWKQDYTNAPNGEVFSDLAKFGEDENVVFRTQMRLSASLQTGKFTNTLAANYKSGYKDEQFFGGDSIHPVVNGVVSVSQVAFVGLDVPSYTTWDWQGKYDYSKALSFTGGIHNLTDKKPPLTLQAQVSGNSAGYDPRYADVIGRAFYVRGNYNF